MHYQSKIKGLVLSSHMRKHDKISSIKMQTAAISGGILNVKMVITSLLVYVRSKATKETYYNIIAQHIVQLTVRTKVI